MSINWKIDWLLWNLQFLYQRGGSEHIPVREKEVSCLIKITDLSFVF